ncbi:MAG: hypothetical protein CMJ31_12425 [Phycisphaerae bacterium]|nr:hypothetical protein [Phycisphaerae bacterium]
MSNNRRQRRHESDGFTCVNCRCQVSGESWGTRHRNHCPVCLFSRHVDETPGDRASVCRGPMAPIGIEVREPEKGGEWALLHRCVRCGAIKANRIAGDDSERALLALALRPLARPAFPLDDPRT